jgi:hypothetical protein
MKDTRRDFLTKSGKAIISGATWTAVSMFGLGATGCDSNWACSDYCTNCTSYCTNCTSGSGSCTNCTSSCTYNTNNNTYVYTSFNITLSGSGFSSNAVYQVSITTKYVQLTKGTDDKTFGSWNGDSFTGNFNLVQHDRTESILIEVKRDIFSSPQLTERQSTSLATQMTSATLSFNSFPIGLYFSVKSNITNTSIGTVDITIRDQSNNTVTSGTTDANGVIKFAVNDPSNNYAIKPGVTYSALCVKTGFKEASQTAIIQTSTSGNLSSSAYVVYMAPV